MARLRKPVQIVRPVTGSGLTPVARIRFEWLGESRGTAMPFAGRRLARLLTCALCAGLALAHGASAETAGTGLPLPRYASLKSDRVNVRKGPGFDYPIAWVYQRVGLPVEILKEFENWRQVRDNDGTEGWVLQNLLSGRRTALVTPWDIKPPEAGKDKPEPTPMRDAGSSGSGVLAVIEPGVLATVLACDRSWCQVSVSDQRGYIEQSKLWGVYPDEAVK
jgi:SH3-like domain-containing protein